MKKLKRNAVVLTVLMFVCVAVYLNWSYSRGQELEQVGADGEQNNSQTVTGIEQEENTSLYYEGEEGEQIESAAYFADVRLTRQQARDSAVEMLRGSVAGENIPAETIEQAMDAIETMAGYSITEAEIESLIKAKGFADCVVFLDDDSATVAVSAPSEGLNEADVSRITEIVLTETSLDATQIEIIEVK